MVEEIGRIDGDEELRQKLLPLCRLKHGEVWQDPINGHRVGVLDATNKDDVDALMGKAKAKLAVCDPPYNIVVGNKKSSSLFQQETSDYLAFSKQWVENLLGHLPTDSSFYVWLGADQKNGFSPFPEFVILMRSFTDFVSRSFITVRNQRGYGTQKNWMAVRQELLYYIKGDPIFNIEAEYTDIPKILRGYYKEVNGEMTENVARGKSENIRAGNVWVDIQQVFYRMEENVPGCYAQKPLKAIQRIIAASSNKKDIVVDLFSHAGTTLMACELSGRKCYTCDLDPIYAEITIRRIERYRKTQRTGWQSKSPFPEIIAEKGNLELF